MLCGGGRNFRKFFKNFGSEIVIKIMFLASKTIWELFASLVPLRITSFSLGDGLEGHFQAIFEPISEL